LLGISRFLMNSGDGSPAAALNELWKAFTFHSVEQKKVIDCN